MSHTIKKNFFYNLLLQMSKVIFPLITAPYVARVLDPEGIGIFNFVNTYSSYFALFAVLGIPIYGIREIAKRRDNLKDSEKFVSQIISIEIISTIIVSVIYIASIFLIQQFNENTILFLIAGILLYITPLKIEWFFSGREEFGYITFRSLIIKTISIILLFLFVKDKDDLINYVVLNVLATISNEVWNYIKLFKLGIHPYITFSGYKEHLRPILILFASSVAISIYVMLDTLMLGFQSSYQEVGYYNSAMHIVKALLPITTALSAVAIPKVSVYIHSNQINQINELINKSLGIVSLLAFPIMLGVILIAPIFVPLFFGHEFYGAILPMQIGSGVIVAIGLNNLNGVQILTGLGKDKQFLCSVLSGAITNFILNWILIPKYGATGAAFSSVFAEVQILFVNEYFVRKYTEIRISQYKNVLKSVIGALLFIPICLICKLFLNQWSYIISCIVLCGIEYIFFQYFTRNTSFQLIYKSLINRINKIQP